MEQENIQVLTYSSVEVLNLFNNSIAVTATKRIIQLGRLCAGQRCGLQRLFLRYLQGRILRCAAYYPCAAIDQE